MIPHSCGMESIHGGEQSNNILHNRRHGEKAIFSIAIVTACPCPTKYSLLRILFVQKLDHHPIVVFRTYRCGIMGSSGLIDIA